jgi:hypothetical protein
VSVISEKDLKFASLDIIEPELRRRMTIEVQSIKEKLAVQA